MICRLYMSSFELVDICCFKIKRAEHSVKDSTGHCLAYTLFASANKDKMTIDDNYNSHHFGQLKSIKLRCRCQRLPSVNINE